MGHSAPRVCGGHAVTGVAMCAWFDLCWVLVGCALETIVIHDVLPRARLRARRPPHSIRPELWFAARIAHRIRDSNRREAHHLIVFEGDVLVFSTPIS